MVLMGLMATVALGCVHICPLHLYIGAARGSLPQSSNTRGTFNRFRNICRTFALEPSDFASRSQVVLSLLLNAVAYKFAVAAELPHVPYSTTFDEYMDASVKFLIVLFIENALVGWPTRYMDGYGPAQSFVDHGLSVAIAVRFCLRSCGWDSFYTCTCFIQATQRLRCT
jgi:hypothetical protein